MMRCRSCGATNRPDATWCTLCLERFDAARSSAPPAPPQGPSPPERPTPAHHAVPEPAASDAAPRASAASASPTTSTAGPADETPPAAWETAAKPQDGGGRGWPCVTCGHENPVALDECAGCGALFASQLRGRSRRAAPPRVTVGALLAGVLLPGMGHVAVGAYASGIARAGLFLLWLLGGVVLLGSGAEALPAAMPLLLGAFVIWGASVADVLALGNAGRQILRGRLLLWLVVGVLGLTLLGGVAALGTAVDTAA